MYKYVQYVHCGVMVLMYCSNDYMYKYILDCEFQNTDTFKIIRLNVYTCT